MEAQILNDILSKTDIRQFNIAMNCYNIQGLYEKRKNHLVNTYFNGDVLRYSVAMRAIFNKFQTTAQEQRAKEIRDQLHPLMKDIKSKKKVCQPHKKEVDEYNSLVNEATELNKGILELTKLFKKIKKDEANEKGLGKVEAHIFSY